MAVDLSQSYYIFNPDARRGIGEYRYNWEAILPAAANIVTSYKDTGVTLRQLFYRLVAAEMLPNTDAAYGSLSSKTAQERRAGRFPSLIDNVRTIARPRTWGSARGALNWMIRNYMQDRSYGQEYNIYLGVEKNGLRAQLFHWFAGMGLPIVALGGYASQTLADEVADDIERDGRPAVLIYAGDFDADGVDIPRDFTDRVGSFEVVRRVALTPDQIEQWNIPPQPGKWTSSRAVKFATEYADLFRDVYGMDLVQIELDALSPDTLQEVYTTEIDKWFDSDALQQVLDDEAEQQTKLEGLRNF